MKIEIGKDFPQYFKPAYPEEFDLFSHFVTAGKPKPSSSQGAGPIIPEVLLFQKKCRSQLKTCISQKRSGIIML